MDLDPRRRDVDQPKMDRVEPRIDLVPTTSDHDPTQADHDRKKVDLLRMRASRWPKSFISQNLSTTPPPFAGTAPSAEPQAFPEKPAGTLYALASAVARWLRQRALAQSRSVNASLGR
jgi:hypothetical protein